MRYIYICVYIFITYLRLGWEGKCLVASASCLEISVVSVNMYIKLTIIPPYLNQNCKFQFETLNSNLNNLKKFYKFYDSKL